MNNNDMTIFNVLVKEIKEYQSDTFDAEARYISDAEAVELANGCILWFIENRLDGVILSDLLDEHREVENIDQSHGWVEYVDANQMFHKCWLKQEAYPSSDNNGNDYYEAFACDELYEYQVIWKYYPEYSEFEGKRKNGELSEDDINYNMWDDASNHCNWDKYTITRIGTR